MDVKDSLISLFILFFNINKIEENNKTVEAKTWVKKYFKRSFCRY